MGTMAHPYFLRLAYLGTAFHGWQVQTSLRSVQGDLWKALRAFDPEAPIPQGTGRTDAGVHARAQGVLVQASRVWDPYRLLAALNAHLPQEIRVRRVQAAPEGFWPRQHAVAKRYVYRIRQGAAEDPFHHLRCWHVHGAEALDPEPMARAARHLVGSRDFSAFRHQDCAARTPLRTLFKAEVLDHGEGLDLVFEGTSFLMHQVRIMSGTLVEVGKGRRDPDSLREALLSRDRRRAGCTAPPHGLYLEEVWYQRRWGVGEPSPWPEGGEEDPEP